MTTTTNRHYHTTISMTCNICQNAAQKCGKCDQVSCPACKTGKFDRRGI